MNTKKLRIFDFDDTLFETEAKVIITSANNTSRQITPAEYAVYEPLPGDKFDFKDFQQVTNPQLIKGYVELLRRMVSSGGSREVYILTARAAERPVSQFIKDLGIGGVKVIALGDNNPEKKADWIEDRVKEGYDDVFFVDDSPKNIDAVRRRLKNYNIKQKIQQVKHF